MSKQNRRPKKLTKVFQRRARAAEIRRWCENVREHCSVGRYCVECEIQVLCKDIYFYVCNYPRLWDEKDIDYMISIIMEDEK